MTKEDAKGILEEYYTNRIYDQIDSGVSPWLNLPINDEVIYTEIKSTEPKIYKEIGELIEDDRLVEFIQWTFKGLIKIAYDL